MFWPQFLRASVFLLTSKWSPAGPVITSRMQPLWFPIDQQISLNYKFKISRWLPGALWSYSIFIDKFYYKVIASLSGVGRGDIIISQPSQPENYPVRKSAWQCIDLTNKSCMPSDPITYYLNSFFILVSAIIKKSLSQCDRWLLLYLLSGLDILLLNFY